MRAALDIYEDLPKAMRRYLMHNGWHFNKSLCDFAVSLMRKNGKRLEPISKENVDKLLDLYKVQINNKIGYDYVFVANMCKADYFGSSIVDDKHVALYIKDTLDDEDAADGTTMRRWYATMVANGITIDWDDSL